MTRPARPLPLHCFPLTDATVHKFHDFLFALWVKTMGRREFKISPGMPTAFLPQNDALKFSIGAACGHAMMAAVDTNASRAMATTDRIHSGTVNQHTHFLRPAINDGIHVKAEVLRFGKASAFAETRVMFA